MQYDSKIQDKATYYERYKSSVEGSYPSYDHDFPKQAEAVPERVSNISVVIGLVLIILVGGGVQFWRIQAAHESMTNFIDIRNQEANDVYEEVRLKAKFDCSVYQFLYVLFI
eukprot:m.37394 g.37394  ORF g.37394 m.37394 type:complete len:112 (+) comp32375_c0_seq1:392-727(+)